MALAAYGMFMDNFGIGDYPYNCPDEQIEEYHNSHMSEKFIETSFKRTLDSMVKRYKEEMVDILPIAKARGF